MKNQTIYNRVEHGTSSPFTIISNKCVNDNKLTFKEVGIMTYLLSQSDCWVVNKWKVLKVSGFGRVSFDKSWKTLEELGYIEMERFQGGVKWTINEERKQ